MSDGDLRSWIRYLQAAAAVPKGDPDYADAQAAVQRAVRKIRFLNRQANRADIATPRAMETAKMSALENTAGDVADVATSAFSSLPEVGPLIEGIDKITRLRENVRRTAGIMALRLKDVDPQAYERGKEAHPTAAAAGELTGPVLLALLGGLNRRALGRGLSERMKPLPEALPPRPRGFVPNEGTVTGGAPAPALRPSPPVPPDPLDVPTFKRRAVPVQEPELPNSAAAEIDRLLWLLRRHPS